MPQIWNLVAKYPHVYSADTTVLQVYTVQSNECTLYWPLEPV